MQNPHLGRRQFIQHSALAVAGAAAAAGTALGADPAVHPAGEGKTSPEVSNKVDVLVVGGGTAGTVAAIQAVRAGAKTLIVERNRQIIDCTGGAEVVGLLNLPRLREDEIQPNSMLFQLGTANTPGRRSLQQLYVHGADSSNSRTVTEANLTGRKAVLARVRKEKKQLMHLQPETSFRESYRIVGETMITVDDYRTGRLFADAVCNVFYPVDLHTRTGVRPEPLKGYP